MFLNSNDPIISIVDKYFKKQKLYNKNANTSSNDVSINIPVNVNKELPEYPLFIVRDNLKRVEKVIHGDIRLLTVDTEGDVSIWQEKMIRDNRGIVTSCEITYPNGSTVTQMYNRVDGKVDNIILG